MGFQPKWNEWWDYYEQITDEEQRRIVQGQMAQVIGEMRGAVRDEALRNAPQDVKDLLEPQVQPQSVCPDPYSQMSTDELQEVRNRIMASVYQSGKPPVTMHDLRQQQKGRSLDSWDIRRIAYYLTWGIFGGGRR